MPLKIFMWKKKNLKKVLKNICIWKSYTTCTSVLKIAVSLGTGLKWGLSTCFVYQELHPSLVLVPFCLSALHVSLHTDRQYALEIGELHLCIKSWQFIFYIFVPNGEKAPKLIIMKINYLSNILKERFQIHKYCYEFKEK